MTSPTQITIKASSAINLTSLADSGSSATKVNLPQGKYAVTLSNDTMLFRPGAPVQQVIIFDVSPVVTKSFEKWFYTVNTSEGTVLNVTEGEPLYVFIVDHQSIKDNSGQATVTFTPL
jgi:hypothetical protein